MLSVVFFFFKQKTAYEMRISDWSSDVCSSDLTHTCTIQHLYGSLGAVFPYTQRRQLSNESPVSNLAPIGSSTRASRKIHHALLPRQKSTLVNAAVQPLRSLVQYRRRASRPPDEIGRASCRERVWTSG